MSALLLENFEALAGAPGGIKKLRELILELAVRGKLVPQDPNDEPADNLLAEVQQQRLQLMEAARIKKEKPTPPVESDEAPYELPAGWAWGRIGDTAQYINGLAFKPDDWGTAGRPIIRIQNLSGRNADYNRTDRVVDDSVVVRPGDILVSWSATLDAYYWNLPEEGVLNQHIFRVIPSGLIEKSYLYLLLKAAIREMEESDHAHGLVMTHINRGPFLAHVVGIPPLSEQSRIVAKVDELMALCDQLESRQSDVKAAHEKLVRELLATITQSQSTEDFLANWQRLAAHFDTLFTTEDSIDALKQAILQLAVMGRLVRQELSDERVTELLRQVNGRQASSKRAKRIDVTLDPLNEDDVPYSLPDNWQWVRFGEVLDFQGGGQPPKSQFSDVQLPGYVQLIQIRDLGKSPQPVFIKKELAAKFCTPDDIMVGRYGASVGKVFWGKSGAYNVALVKMVDQFGLFHRPYLFHLLRSDLGQSLFLGISRSAQDGFNKTDIERKLIPLCSLSEQRRISEKLDELLVICDALNSRVTALKAEQEAFAGVLVERAVA